MAVFIGYIVAVIGDGCTNGDLRLQGGSTVDEGELQVCRDGIWGYVCDNSAKHENAQTFCRQMQKSTNCKYNINHYLVIY